MDPGEVAELVPGRWRILRRLLRLTDRGKLKYLVCAPRGKIDIAPIITVPIVRWVLL